MARATTKVLGDFASAKKCDCEPFSGGATVRVNSLHPTTAKLKQRS